MGGLTLPLNDCTEAGVQGLHTCADPGGGGKGALAPPPHKILLPQIVRRGPRGPCPPPPGGDKRALAPPLTKSWIRLCHSEEFFPPLASEKVVGLSPPTHTHTLLRVGGGAKAPSAPPRLRHPCIGLCSGVDPGEGRHGSPPPPPAPLNLKRAHAHDAHSWTPPPRLGL